MSAAPLPSGSATPQAGLGAAPQAASLAGTVAPAPTAGAAGVSTSQPLLRPSLHSALLRRDLTWRAASRATLGLVSVLTAACVRLGSYRRVYEGDRVIGLLDVRDAAKAGRQPSPALARQDPLFSGADIGEYLQRIPPSSHHADSPPAEAYYRRPLITVSNHRSVFDDPLTWSSVLPMRRLLGPSSSYRWTLGAQELCFLNSAVGTFFGLGRIIPVLRGGGYRQPGLGLAVDIINGRMGNQPTSGFEPGIDASSVPTGKSPATTPPVHLLGPEELVQHARELADSVLAWLHLFPEAYVNQREDMIPLRWGVGRCIMEARLPPVVIPIWHEGFQLILPEHQAYHFRPWNQLDIAVGRPIDFTSLLAHHRVAGTSADDIRAHIADVITMHLLNLQSATLRARKRAMDIVEEQVRVLAEGKLSPWQRLRGLLPGMVTAPASSAAADGSGAGESLRNLDAWRVAPPLAGPTDPISPEAMLAVTRRRAPFWKLTRMSAAAHPERVDPDRLYPMQHADVDEIERDRHTRRIGAAEHARRIEASSNDAASASPRSWWTELMDMLAPTDSLVQADRPLPGKNAGANAGGQGQ
ncbi:hypothetical protein H696_04902 [Fonticula alba]|uniref:Phospholipid/glycerol acyltransferase domain-containing protein n=1 Tax=Fonticula alba TaxID=691883 RepID=A0A058Z2V2_FONAL|nr:hypothetical protein H696_04902 [Fonticula alba]KCV68609.1 hypothetical protein H696_04902 [Fonticula alba]|eukprot:XP_009497041.1 hypothetical protein H696_04902 [Fonticula alba]